MQDPTFDERAKLIIHASRHLLTIPLFVPSHITCSTFQDKNDRIRELERMLEVTKKHRKKLMYPSWARWGGYFKARIVQKRTLLYCIVHTWYDKKIWDGNKLYSPFGEKDTGGKKVWLGNIDRRILSKVSLGFYYFFMIFQTLLNHHQHKIWAKRLISEWRRNRIVPSTIILVHTFLGGEKTS